MEDSPGLSSKDLGSRRCRIRLIEFSESRTMMVGSLGIAKVLHDQLFFEASSPAMSPSKSAHYLIPDLTAKEPSREAIENVHQCSFISHAESSPGVGLVFKVKTALKKPQSSNCSSVVTHLHAIGPNFPEQSATIFKLPNFAILRACGTLMSRHPVPDL